MDPGNVKSKLTLKGASLRKEGSGLVPLKACGRGRGCAVPQLTGTFSPSFRETELLFLFQR